MIIIGYPGVGKSTAASQFIEVIDLETVNMFDVYTYCKIAEDLSKSGYIVCVNSHQEIQEHFMGSQELVYACFPSKELKTAWANMLRKRYINTEFKDDRYYPNYRAYMRVADCFDEDIKHLSSRGFDNIELVAGVFLSDVIENSFKHNIEEQIKEQEGEVVEDVEVENNIEDSKQE